MHVEKSKVAAVDQSRRRRCAPFLDSQEIHSPICIHGRSPQHYADHQPEEKLKMVTISLQAMAEQIKVISFFFK